MRRDVKIQDIVDALGMENLIISIDGDTPCNAIMSMYTEPEGMDVANQIISGVTYNSKDVSDGCLFVCKGVNFREEYLDEAIERGAICYVREAAEVVSGRGYSCSTGASEAHTFGQCVGIYVSDIRKAMPIIAGTYYGRLDEKIRLIGVTGTKGKSSTVYFIRAILDEYMNAIGEKKTAVCSGIENYDGVISEESHLTTPEILELHQHMDNAIKCGIRYLSAEISSQALKYDRVSGIEFEAGAFLNIGSDHISPVEHADLEDYLGSKLKIFGQCRKACYSLDADRQEEIEAASKNCPYVITFSRKNASANVYAHGISIKSGKVMFCVSVKGVDGYENFDEEVRLSMPGTVNVENALAAISLSVLAGVPKEHIISGLSKVRVPGRMEIFKSDDGRRTVIVDYAHNKLSFDNFFENADKEYPGKKIISVFGSAGGKAYIRRAELGESAGHHATYSIITEDDSGPEDAESICREIAGYVEAAGGKCEIVVDRADAIKRAIDIMDDDTILFVAGRGSDSGMKRESGYIDYPADSKIVEEYL